jgi:monoterpene epsilon-lactone hydrolase
LILRFRLHLLTLLMRLAVKPRLARTATPQQARADLERGARWFRAPPFLLHLSGKGALPLDQISIGQPREDVVVLYFHGGAYLAGSPKTHAPMLGRLAKLTGLRIIAPAYRLAPEHPAPAAFNDACTAYHTLMTQGYRADQIILGGDSAGGGLALALLSQLCKDGLQPLGCFAFSPWTDLSLTGRTLQDNALKDPLLPVQRIVEAVGFVQGMLGADDPRLSPLFAGFPDPPPVQIHVGSTEILRDDSRRMADHLRACGGEVTLHEVQGAPHVWPLFDGYIPEARTSLRLVADFIALRISSQLPAEN